MCRFLGSAVSKLGRSLRTSPEPVILVPICVRREDLTDQTQRAGEVGLPAEPSGREPMSSLHFRLLASFNLSMAWMRSAYLGALHLQSTDSEAHWL